MVFRIYGGSPRKSNGCCDLVHARQSKADDIRQTYSAIECPIHNLSFSSDVDSRNEGRGVL